MQIEPGQRGWRQRRERLRSARASADLLSADQPVKPVRRCAGDVPPPESGLLSARFGGPDWLTDGGLGIESSVVSVILLAAVGVTWLSMIHHNGIALAPSWVRRRRLRPALI